MRNIYASYIRTAYVQRQLEHKIQGLMSRVAHLERVADLNPPLGSGGPCLAISRAMRIDPTKLNDLTRPQALQYNELVGLLNATPQKMDDFGIRAYTDPNNAIMMGYRSYDLPIRTHGGMIRVEITPHTQWRLDARRYSESLLEKMLTSDLATEEGYRNALYLSLFERDSGVFEEKDPDKRRRELAIGEHTLAYVPISNAHSLRSIILEGKLPILKPSYQRKKVKLEVKTSAARRRPSPKPPSGVSGGGLGSDEMWSEDSYTYRLISPILLEYRKKKIHVPSEKEMFAKAMDFLIGKGLKLEGVLIKTLLEYGKDDPLISCKGVPVPEPKVEIVKPKVEESEEP